MPAGAGQNTSTRWPQRPVPWGDKHLPPSIRAALRRGELRREFFGFSTGTRVLDAGGRITARVPVGDEAHFEWVQIVSETRTAGAFRVQLELERLVGEKPQPQKLGSDGVAWESISGAAGEPYWIPPVFVPASSAIIARVTCSAGVPFRAVFVGARLVR